MRYTGTTITFIRCTTMLMASAGVALAEGNTGTVFVIWEQEGAAGEPLLSIDQICASVSQGRDLVVARRQGPADQGAGKLAAIT